MKTFRMVMLLGIIALVASAYGCGSPSASPGMCEPDPERVAAQDRCQTDETCPCGTFCDLGRCMAECTGDEECSDGTVCNSYGQCRSPEEANQLRMPSEQTGGQLRFTTSERRLPAGYTAQVDLRSGEHPVARSRVEAQYGVQMRCPGSEEWVVECELTEVDARTTVTLDVQRGPAEDQSEELDPDDIAMLEAFTAQGSDTISLLRHDQGLGQPDDDAEPPAVISGQYDGQIRLIGVGTDRDLGALADPPAPITHPISARVWQKDAQFVVAIDDERNALTGRDTFIGRLDFGAEDADTGVRDGTAQFPVHPFIETTVGGRKTVLLNETVDARILTANRPRTLELELTQSYLGVGGAVAPSVRWILELERSAGVRGLAPVVPDDAGVEGYDPADRLDDPTPWEAAFGETVAAAIDPASAIAWYEGGMAPLAMCDAGTDKAEVAEAILGEWMDLDGKTIGEIPTDDTPFNPLFVDLLDRIGEGSTLSFTELAAPQLSDNEFPCDLFNVNVNVEEGGGSWSGYVSAVNFCDELQANTGCVVKTVPEPTVESSATGSYTDPWGGSGPATATFSMKVAKTCVLPDASADCAEGIFCMEAGEDTNQTPPYASVLFDEDASTLTESDDYRCASGSRVATIALDQVSGAESGDNAPTVVGSINNCLDELEALPDRPPTASPGQGWAGFEALYEEVPQCVDVGRLLTVLAVQTQSLRGAHPITDVDIHAPAAAYTHRLLNRWLALHSFLISESTQLEDMKAAFTSDDSSGEPQTNFIDGVDARNATVRGWDLVLSQHVLHALLNTPQPVLDNPDYRFHRTGLQPPGRDEQKQALAAVMLETLTRQTGHLNKVMQKSMSMTAEQRRALLGEFTARSLVAQALAADMQAQAAQGNPQPYVPRQYERAAERLRAKTSTTNELLRELASGTNPLAIADRNLPLYFRTSTITGAVGRFTAVSDFLIGTGINDSAWAPKAVSDAQEALNNARQSFIDQAERNLEAARYDRDVQAWADGVRADYNAKLRDYCGPLEGSPIDDPNFNAARCAIDHQNPECSFKLKDWYDEFTTDDTMGRFCVHEELLDSSMGYSAGFADTEMRDFARRCYRPNAEDRGAVSIQACESDPELACLRCEADPLVGELELKAASFELMGRKSDSMDTDGSSPWNVAWRECRAHYPGLRRHVPQNESPIEKPACLTGALGEAYLGVVSANFDLQEAREDLREHIDAYDIAMKSCFRLQEKNDTLKEERDSHRETMRDLRISKAFTDTAATVASSTKDCLAAMTSADKDDPLSLALNSAAITGTCMAAAAEASSKIASIGLQAEMDGAQMKHDDRVANLEANAEEDICFNDAKLELVGASTAAIAIERAAFDLESAQANVDGLIVEAQRLHTDGHAYVTESEQFDTPPPVGDPWFDEKVDTYTRNFKLARRATYLAVRAVEYEFQQSMSLRDDVLTAEVPDDLKAVLQQLWGESGPSSVGGSRPSELSTVLSLRDDILQLGDESDWPEAMRPLPPRERFKVLLTSERFAVYDEQGRYSGQQIPFSLAPLGALGVDARGVSIYSQNDCAERLWSVNASMVGEDLFRGSDTSFVRVDLLKRNTFYSQWCGEAPQGQPFQLATVRPTQNLFREPGVGEDFGEEQGVEQEANRFSRARIQAFFGVDRAALEDTQYANGETSELAARGLYGDYALYIPANLIARDGEDGLVLDNVDDILLRLDYLSVAKP